MRILFFSHYFPPEGNAPASRVFEFCRRWVRMGHEVEVITCAPNVPNGVVYPGYQNAFRDREVMEGIDALRVWTYLAPNRGTVRRSLNYLSYLVSASIAGLRERRPDVVIATSPQFFCGWAGVVVSGFRRLPFILEIRDIWPESIETVGALRKGFLTRTLERLEQRMYAAADSVVAVGEGYKEKMVERSVPADKIRVITNGVNTSFFVPRAPNAELARKYGLEGKFVCSYVGTIGMACGLDIVLRTAQQLRDQKRDDIRFLLVGDGATRTDLEARAKAEGLDNVVFTGMQPKERIPDFLGLSGACLVHLQKKELFKSVLPSKMLEACAMEKPVILGVEGHAAALLNQMNAGICIEPEDAEALSAAVTRLAADPGLARQLGHNGRNYVDSHFNPDKLARSYMDVIQQVIQK